MSIRQTTKLSVKIFSVHMTYAGKRIIEVTNFVKKVEGVRCDGKVKALSKKSRITSKFQGSYPRGSGRQTLSA